MTFIKESKLQSSHKKIHSILSPASWTCG